MDSNTNSVEALKQFADESLKNNFEELNTRYQNEALSSAELTPQVYKEHQKIYNIGLDETISSLHTADNPWLKRELEKRKTSIYSKAQLQ